MSSIAQLAEVAALIGDPARANILVALLDGRALPAGELAAVAGVSPQTASGHLSQLVTARLLSVRNQGRHRYYQLATKLIGPMLESILAVAGDAPPRRTTSRVDADLRTARTCYNHLAGRLGVALADSLIAGGHVELDDEGNGAVTDQGAGFLQEFGLDLQAKKARGRLFCRACIDWSERRPHLAGHVGAALCTRCLELGWISRRRDSRALTITEAGRQGLRSRFGIHPETVRLQSAAASPSFSS
jgi:DNA-binding transcriptional ArsR family regulator